MCVQVIHVRPNLLMLHIYCVWHCNTKCEMLSLIHLSVTYIGEATQLIWLIFQIARQTATVALQMTLAKLYVIHAR
jgi:hypothetical protein